MAHIRQIVALCGVVLTLVVASAARGQDGPAAGDDLSVEQARLADRFQRLEEVLGRLAELSASTDPRRARLLREAIARSREQDINVRFEAVVALLENERLSAAVTNQVELQKELDALLTLLLKADRDTELESERERIRKYLRELSRLIRLQKGVRARTEGGVDFERLAGDQQQLADDTDQLGGTIEEREGADPAAGGDAREDDARDSDSQDGDTSDESDAGDSQPGDGERSQSGEPSEGQPGESGESESSEGAPSEGAPSESGESQPSESQPGGGQPGSPSPGGESEGESSDQDESPTERATERLRRAQQQMEQARQRLREAEREDAADRQREALRELEQAKAELERVLRQLREEELERMLTQLAARFRKMLEWQVAVYEGTMRLDGIPEADRGHEDEIEAARLSRQERLIVAEADKALLLLREEGSSVAFPEAIEQMRDDMQQVAERLAALKVDVITQGLEQDIIAALEETIAALEKALQDLEQNRTPPGGAPPAGQMSDPPLVDKLAELKMIRALQMRINVRTQRYGEMIAGKSAQTPDLLEALEDLAERQQRVWRATLDLSQGRND